MVKIYIDFDGVIMDTSPHLFDIWCKIPFNEKLSENTKIKYMKLKRWMDILNQAKVINDSINELKNMDTSNTTILTKVHSLENEGVSKIRFLRDKGIRQNIIIVPYYCKKTDIVDAYGNILVDDCVKNLDEWKSMHGIPIFFNKDALDNDEWKNVNTEYPKIKTLKSLSTKLY